MVRNYCVVGCCLVASFRRFGFSQSEFGVVDASGVHYLHSSFNSINKLLFITTVII